MKKLGVIGGMGPLASAHFLSLVTQMTEARVDQEHIEVLLYSRPQIPDRTAYILGKSQEDPFPMLADTGRHLAEWGAEVIAVPCVTSGFFKERLEAEVGRPILDIPGETAACFREAGVTKAGILVTNGTREAGVLRNVLAEAGIEALFPDEARQAEVMQLIYDQIKAGRPVDMDQFERVSGALFSQGAQAVLLGCTELSLIDRKICGVRHPDWRYLDALEVLARGSVLRCGHLKEEYQKLL